MNKLMLRFLAVVLAVLTLVVWASAQAESGAQNPVPRPIVVHAARLLQVRSGRTLTDQLIVIENQRIVSITSAAPLSAGKEKGRRIRRPLPLKLSPTSWAQSNPSLP